MRTEPNPRSCLSAQCHNTTACVMRAIIKCPWLRQALKLLIELPCVALKVKAKIKTTVGPNFVLQSRATAFYSYRLFFPPFISELLERSDRRRAQEHQMMNIYNP